MGENYRPLVQIKCPQQLAEEYETSELNHASRVA
jgi:hypothetical protein